MAAAIRSGGGQDASAYRVAEQYIAAFGSLAQGSNTLVVPANASDVGAMVAQVSCTPAYASPQPKSVPTLYPYSTLTCPNSDPITSSGLSVTPVQVHTNSLFVHLK